MNIIQSMPRRKTHFIMLLQKTAVSQLSFCPQSHKQIGLSFGKLNFKHVSFKSLFYVSAFILSYKLLEFEILSHSAFVLGGFYCICDISLNMRP